MVRLARENSGWGYDRILGALGNLGHRVSDQTVGNILRRHGTAPAPKRSRTTTWTDFIRRHRAVLAGTDFFTVEVLTWRGLVTWYVLFFLIHGTLPCGAEPSRKEQPLAVPAEQDKRRPPVLPPIRCKERLGGLLKYYHRRAA